MSSTPKKKVPIILCLCSHQTTQTNTSSDVVARLSLFFLSQPDPAFLPLLRSLFTPSTLENTMIVLLLDWNKPWEWLRQLRTWVRLLRSLFETLDEDAKWALNEVTGACMCSGLDLAGD